MKRIILGLILLLLIPLLIVQAQDTPLEVTYNTPVEGEITAEATTQTWNLNQVTADRILIEVERLDGNLIPDISLLDANGQVLSASYGADESNAYARIESFTLPGTGDYRILVGREGAAAGLTLGKYRLTVTPQGVAEDNPNISDITGAISYDQPVTGTITSDNWRNLYTLKTEAGDRIHVTLERTDGTLYPYVEVRDANGTSISTGYPADTYDRAELEASLPGSGEYQIMVQRYNAVNENSEGDYTLTITLLAAGEGSGLLAEKAGTVAYDTPVVGQIGDGVWYQDWRLITDAPDRISVTATRTDGNLMPEVILLGGSGQEITRGYNSNTGEAGFLQYYDLQEAGSYTIRVARYNGYNGNTTGTYELVVNLMGSGEGSANLTPREGAVITMEKPVQGELTNARWADTWTFVAEAGIPYTFTAKRTGSTLIPMILIRDANGVDVNLAYPNETQDAATFENFTFPSAGTYQIIVLRSGDRGGWTQGAYELSITPGQ